VLIPVHLLLMGYLADECRFRQRAKAWLVPIAWMLLGSLCYVLVYLQTHKGVVSASPFLAIRADLEFAKVFFATAAGTGTEDSHDLPIQGFPIRLLCVVAVGCAATLWGARRERGSWKVPLAALLLVLLDNLPIALSNRSTWMGLPMMHQTRFGYEEWHLLAVLAAIWCKRTGVENALAVRRKVAWGMGFALVLAYGAVGASYVKSGRHHRISLLRIMDQSHRYLDNLRTGIAPLGDGTPVFQNDRVPSYLSLFRITPDTRTLLPLFLPHARFDDTAVPRYMVLGDGRIVRAP
jgi:hypothetical protein